MKRATIICTGGRWPTDHSSEKGEKEPDAARMAFDAWRSGEHRLTGAQEVSGEMTAPVLSDTTQ